MEWVLGLVEGPCSFVQLLTLTSRQKLEKLPTVSYVAKFQSSDRLKSRKLFYRRLYAGVGGGGGPPNERGGGGRGGDSHMKGAGMVVVSLRGVNFRFWSR